MSTTTSGPNGDTDTNTVFEVSAMTSIVLAADPVVVQDDDDAAAASSSSAAAAAVANGLGRRKQAKPQKKQNGNCSKISTPTNCR
jgi:hypothetical protein